MVPRADVVFFKVGQPLAECLETVQRTKHTRYPLCEDSLDHVIGVVHIKDLVGACVDDAIDLRELARPPHHVPETMPISKLLGRFQTTHQLLAHVVDEQGTVVGIVTLENVLEEIIGAVDDEFDAVCQDISPEGEGCFVISGGAALHDVNEQLGLAIDEPEVDTLAGVLLARVDRVLQVGDQVSLNGATAELIEVEGSRAMRIRITMAASGPNTS